MVYRFLQDGDISIHDDRWFVPPWGVNGGQPGARSWKQIERANGDKAMLPAKADNIRVKKDDLLHYVTWGGGGWGDPLQRDPALVVQDVNFGLVTAEATKNYGVVLAADGSVDEAATASLREKMASERGETSLFDYGDDIETLRKNCLKETGMEAPVEPEWS